MGPLMQGVVVGGSSSNLGTVEAELGLANTLFPRLQTYHTPTQCIPANFQVPLQLVLRRTFVPFPSGVCVTIKTGAPIPQLSLTICLAFVRLSQPIGR